jgi:transposase
MKSKHFYSHLVELSDITIDLGDLEITPEERLHLISLLEANIHNTVINTVLSQLRESEKRIFLTNLVKNDHKEIWKHLVLNSKDIEEKIKAEVKKLIKEMKIDIKKVKSLK